MPTILSPPQCVKASCGSCVINVDAVFESTSGNGMDFGSAQQSFTKGLGTPCCTGILQRGHYTDVIMSVMASQITSLTIVYSTIYSRRRSKKTSKLRVAGLCAGNSPVTGEFPTQMASNVENVSIWWCHHEKSELITFEASLYIIYMVYWEILQTHHDKYSSCHSGTKLILNHYEYRNMLHNSVKFKLQLKKYICSNSIHWYNIKTIWIIVPFTGEIFTCITSMICLVMQYIPKNVNMVCLPCVLFYIGTSRFYFCIIQHYRTCIGEIFLST